jgi:hypothetical protein
VGRVWTTVRVIFTRWAEGSSSGRGGVIFFVPQRFCALEGVSGGHHLGWSTAIKMRLFSRLEFHFVPFTSTYVERAKRAQADIGGRRRTTNLTNPTNEGRENGATLDGRIPLILAG